MSSAPAVPWKRRDPESCQSSGRIRDPRELASGSQREIIIHKRGSERRRFFRAQEALTMQGERRPLLMFRCSLEDTYQTRWQIPNAEVVISRLSTLASQDRIRGIQ